MIVLDTNVLSEALNPAPDEGVMAWLASQPRAGLFTTAITRAEILYGLGLWPDGSRRRELTTAGEAIFDEDFAGRVLGFDSDAAEAYATIVVARKECRLADQPVRRDDSRLCAIKRGGTGDAQP